MRKINTYTKSREEFARAVKVIPSGVYGHLGPAEGCFIHLPAVSADRRERDKFILNGAPYPCAAAPGRYRVLGPEGEFLMVGEVKDGIMTTVKSFFEVERK